MVLGGAVSLRLCLNPQGFVVCGGGGWLGAEPIAHIHSTIDSTVFLTLRYSLNYKAVATDIESCKPATSRTAPRLRGKPWAV